VIEMREQRELQVASESEWTEQRIGSIDRCRQCQRSGCLP
jgi:hypothetical protein